MAQARTRRQKGVLRPGGPSYETVLKEGVLHRLAVPRVVMAAQVRHVLEVVGSRPEMTFRLLPKSAFLLFTFTDPENHPVAVVDTATTDLVLTEQAEVARYTGQYDRIRQPPAGSAAFLGRMLDRLRSRVPSAMLVALRS